MNDSERREQGMRIRRAVLGDAHVDRARASASDLTAEFQDLITRYAWGEIWARPGLPRATRSLVTVAMLVALNRPEELRMHLRAAVACGVTREELREVLLHAAIYCGVPAAHAAFGLAEAELASPGAAQARRPQMRSDGRAQRGEKDQRRRSRHQRWGPLEGGTQRRRGRSPRGG